MLAVAWPALIDALVRVEDVAADDSGLLSFGVAPGSGGIFVEKGRICWAAAHGLQRRLRDLIQDSASVRHLDLDSIYERCRAEGRMLGQTLVEEGLIAPRELETALRRHSAESLVALSHSDQLTIWQSRGGHGFAPQFTFRPLDVLFDVVNLSVPHLQHMARAELATFERPGRRGAAYLLDGAHDSPIPLAELGDGMSVHALWTLGRWALALPHASRELGATPTFALASTAGGDTIAVWWRGAVLFAVACDERASLTTLIAQHLAAA